VGISNLLIADIVECSSAERWEIIVRYREAGKIYVGRMTFSMSGSAQVQSGTGLMSWSRGRSRSQGFATDVEGSIDETSAFLQLYILHRPIGHSPLVCEGSAVEPSARYEGRWSNDCLNPRECGCRGASGEFTLVRSA
jgi:hypothetical protein